MQKVQKIHKFALHLCEMPLVQFSMRTHYFEKRKKLQKQKFEREI